MQLAFVLTMPKRGSWNGRWSGENDFYCIIKSFTGKKEITRAMELLQKKSWHYSWGDGWGANISVEEVGPAESRRMKKVSKGFCGYDWMVNTILLYGRPMADHEVKDFLQRVKEKEEANVTS